MSAKISSFTPVVPTTAAQFIASQSGVNIAATAAQIAQTGVANAPTGTSLASGDLIPYLAGGAGGTLETILPLKISDLAAAAALTGGFQALVTQNGSDVVLATNAQFFTWLQSSILAALQQPVHYLTGVTETLDATVNLNVQAEVQANQTLRLPAGFASAGAGYLMTVWNPRGFTVNFTDNGGTQLTYQSITGTAGSLNGSSTSGFLNVSTVSTGNLQTTADYFTILAYVDGSGTNRFYVKTF